jgi:hypothetical protein
MVVEERHDQVQQRLPGRVRWRWRRRLLLLWRLRLLVVCYCCDSGGRLIMILLLL